MSDSNSLFDFYDYNSSNSFLKFEASSPLFELSPPLSNGPSSPAESSSFLGSNSLVSDTKDKLKMDSTINNPLLTTASMPIPARNVSSNSNMSNNNINNNNSRMINDFSDVIFEFESSKSPISSHTINETTPVKQQQYPMVINYGGGDNYGQQNTFNANNVLMWEINPMMATTAMDQSNSAADMSCDKSGPFQMDEDDIFQVDKSDLIQGPTLAELNGDNLLVDLINMEDFLNDSSQHHHHQQHIVGQNSQLTQLTAVNFQNLQNIINESTATSQLSPTNQYHSIAIPQTPHNTPIPSFQTSSGGQIIFYDDPNSSGSPYDVYSPPNTLTISTTLRNVASTPNQLSAFSPGSHSSTSTSSIVLNSSLSPPPSSHTPIRGPRSRAGRSTGLVQHNPKYSTLKSLLTEKALSNAQNASQQSSHPSSAVSPSGLPTRRFNMQGGGIISRLSSSAPTAFGLEQIWARREPRPHLLSTGSLAEGQQGSTSSLSGDILSTENIDYSHDDSDDDSDHYEDFSSDSDDEDNKDHIRSMMASDGNNNQKGGYSKKGRYFWQYNVQAKGPKGQRLIIKTQAGDPHNLSEATDPVFSPSCSIRGIKSVQIKHSGKARKGDGNDLVPNAKKLNAIGKELDKLGRVINDMTPVSELPFNVRPKTRKEKNKLASRACRLKKKAQHEANKIKLFGLEHEHKRLINGIATMKHLLAMKCSSSNEKQEEINQRMEQVVVKATVVKIADNSTEYVNRVIERAKAGVPNGGLEEF